MPKIAVTDRLGQIRIMEASADGTLLQALRDGGDDNLPGICGGCCSCATCHVYLDIQSKDKIPAPSPDEEALLEALEFRTAQSRLSCQIELTEGMSQLYIIIPPQE